MKKQFLILLTSLVMLSCSESNNVAPNIQKQVAVSEPSNSSARTGEKQYEKWLKKNPFIVTSYYIGGQPANQFFQPCELDNVLYFYDNGVFLELEGDLKCGVSDTADYGTWAVTDTTFTLNTVNFPNAVFDILEFHPKSFRVVSPTTTLGANLEAVK